MTDARATLRDSAGFALSQYLARAVVLVRGVLAASALGPAGYGGWNALNLILDYGYFAPAGALQGLDLRLPAAVARADAGLARRWMAGAWSACLAGAALFAATVLLLPGAGRALAGPFPAGVVALMLGAALLQLAFLYLSSALRAHGRIGAVSRGQSLQAVAGGGLGIAMLWKWEVWGLILGWMAGTLAAAAWMARAIPEAPLIPAAPREGVVLARAGLPIFGFYVLSLALRSSDRLAFVHFGHAAALGQYGVGLMAAGLVLYLPEAVGFVLFPRLAAAAQGARDAAAARAEVVRAQRVMALALPIPVALATVWAGPVVRALLPEFSDGVGALRLLAFGALMFSVSTLPGYFLLASGRHRRLLAVGVGAVLFNGALVFAAAARDPRPAGVAAAALAGYSAFALGLVIAASFALVEGRGERLRFAARSFVPGIWTAGVTLAAAAALPSESSAAALIRTAIVLACVVPVVAGFARGTGLARLARERLPAFRP